MTAIFAGGAELATALCARTPQTGPKLSTASAAKMPMERELTIILTPSCPFRKSQIADYSEPNSRASMEMLPSMLLPCDSAGDLSSVLDAMRELVAGVGCAALSRQGNEKHCPVRRVRYDGDVGKRIHGQRVLWQPRNRYGKRLVGAGSDDGRQCYYRANLQSQQIGHGDRAARGVRTHQRAREIVIRDRRRIDADFERRYRGADRVDDIHGIAEAGTDNEAAGRVRRRAVVVQPTVRRHRIVNHRT